MTVLPLGLVELFVMIQVYFLAAYYALKELIFEARNRGLRKRLENEIRKSGVLRCSRSKRVFITGADGTIGREVVRKFLRYDYIVHAVVGDRQKASEMFSSLNGSHWPLTLYEVDFADPQEVAKFARGFAARCGKINIAVFCAGTMLTSAKFIDNVEHHMCINVVSQALLLELLNSVLENDARIMFLSSSTLRVSHFTGSMLQGDLLSYYAGPYQAYSLSKLVLSLYVSQLSLEKQQCIATVHPGVIPGMLYRNTNTVVKFFTYMILPYLLRKPVLGALLVIHTTVRDDLVTGSYYEDGVAEQIGNALTEKDRLFVYDSVRRQVAKWAGLKN